MIIRRESKDTLLQANAQPHDHDSVSSTSATPPEIANFNASAELTSVTTRTLSLFTKYRCPLNAYDCGTYTATNSCSPNSCRSSCVINPIRQISGPSIFTSTALSNLRLLPANASKKSFNVV